MPPFHFDVQYDQEPWSRDEYNAEFPSADDARTEALSFITMMARDKLCTYSSIAVRVRDGESEPIQTLRLSLQTEDRA